MRTSLVSLAAPALVLVLQHAAFAQIEQAPTQRVLPTAGSHGDRYGSAVALTANTLAVGAPGAGSGAVHVLVLGGGAWTPQAELSVAGIDTDADFGASVALAGDLLVVGAPRVRAGTSWHMGAAYVYERAAGVWTLRAHLVSGDPNIGGGELFGAAVATDGQRVVVGAPNAAGTVIAGAGAAFVFESVAGTWTRVAALRASDGWVGARFGASVAVGGEMLLVGAPRRSTAGPSPGPDAVYVFEHGGSGWTETQILVEPTPAIPGSAMRHVGSALALDGNTFVAGAFDEGSSEGAVVFERALGTWSHVQSLHSVMTLVSGCSVGVEGSTIVVGARLDSPSPLFHEGNAAIWERQSSGWSERRRPIDSQPQSLVYFGSAVAIAGGRCAVGAPGQTNGAGPGSGAVEVFALDGVVGEIECFGDGSGAACPCGTNTEAVHGPGCNNSYGRGALVVGHGTTSVAADDLTVTGVQLLTTGSLAILAYGTGAVNGGAGAPLANGLRCIGGQTGRLGVRAASAWPWTATWGPNLAAQLGAASGSTYRFQVWYRNPAATCGGGSNSSNAFRVTFTP